MAADDDPAVSAGRLPFQEQIKFFRRKLNLPTRRWDDITRAAHDRAFIVAGAEKADLLQDLREIVDGVIAEGKTIQWFRDNFDDIVGRHGWSYTGPRDWRTRVIYTTNMSASYAAGRQVQLQRFEYWRYKHNDSVQHPRPLHVSWDGLILPKDDPWWQTHYPPNGWGCGCRVVAVTPAEAKRAGKMEAPDDGTYIRTVGGVTHTIPKGIDYGWDYAPGKLAHEGGAVRVLSDKLIRWDAPLGARAWKEFAQHIQPEIEAEWAGWLKTVFSSDKSHGRSFLAGALGVDELEYLARRGATPGTAGVVVHDRLLVGAKAERHVKAGDALTADEWGLLPHMLSNPEQVLFDSETENLLYVLPSPDNRKTKLVLALDYVSKGKVINSARTVFKLPPGAIAGGIKGGRYEEIR